MESQWNKDRQSDWDDFNNELSVLEVGRLQRFLTDDEVGIYGEDRKKKEERQHLNRLEQLLIDEAYQALYQSTLRSLYETQSAVYEALKDAGETLQHLEAQRDVLLEQASTLPSG